MKICARDKVEVHIVPTWVRVTSSPATQQEVGHVTVNAKVPEETRMPWLFVTVNLPNATTA
ncbi:MAG: hypothetical protein M3P47_03035 [Pseudomonadota bacterium]|nr:hypothetical protein [Pseudomonadota bacterium]